MTKVLIVERDLVQGMAYMRSFIVAHFDVERATNESTAIEAISRHNPEVVVINLQMPGNKALRLIKWIRSESRLPSLPIVGFVRENDGDLLTEAQLAGANECHVVGKTGAELLAVVRNLLKVPVEAKPPSHAAFEPAHPLSPPPVPPPKPAPAPAAVAPRPAPLQPPPPPRPTSPADDEIIQPIILPKVEAIKVEELPSDYLRTLLKLKELSQFLLRAENKATQPPLILDLSRKAQEFSENEVVLSAVPLKKVADVLVGLLNDLSRLPQAITVSTMRTVHQIVTFLDAMAKQPLGHVEFNASDFKVLVVDDEAVARRVIKGALGLVQLTPQTAKDPGEAIQFAMAQRFDLFVLDVNMPGMTGYDLCGRLRKSVEYHQTPVIFVTAWNTFESRLRFAQSGGDDFIAKPFMPTELAAKALIHLLERRMGLKKM
jgi:CheY-like chemotaxis protein